MTPENIKPIKSVTWGNIPIKPMTKNELIEVYPEVNQNKFTQCGMTESISMQVELLNRKGKKFTNSEYWKFKSIFKGPKLPRKLKKKIYGTRSMRKRFIKKHATNNQYNEFLYSFLQQMAKEKNTPLYKIIKYIMEPKEQIFLPMKPVLTNIEGIEKRPSWHNPRAIIEPSVYIPKTMD